MVGVDSKIQNNFRELHYRHFSAGNIYGQQCLSRTPHQTQESDLAGIYNLVESHVPNFRFTAALRHDKSQEENTNLLSLNKNYLGFHCAELSMDDQIKNLLEQISEMPEEWTLVQLTPEYSIEEGLEMDSEKFHTNALHITVFHCGKNQSLPFTVKIDPPIDKISGDKIEIRQEMHSILVGNLEGFKILKPGIQPTNEKLHAYKAFRHVLNSKLQNLVNVIQNKWLCEWRCLLMGKFIDEKHNKMITEIISNILKDKDKAIDNGKKNLLTCLIKASHVLTLIELKKAIRLLFPEDTQKTLRISIFKQIRDLRAIHNFSKELRYPIILIVDEKLDFIPWEMIDILQDHPASRMPSLHFTYALFKEHKSSIVDGYKVNVMKENGTYILNPGKDLKGMEARMSSFLSYWLPEWRGIVGVAPSATEFQDCLVSSDIFVYSGHGSGTQFLSGEAIQKLRINATVFLFGCGSVMLSMTGPKIEMSSSYQMYLIACSPCVVGMLWTVTDTDTDTISAEFFSSWLPSAAENSWKLINIEKWKENGSLQFSKNNNKPTDKHSHEPDLLRALSKAKKAAKQYLMKAACVARGLPVKIQ